MSDPYRILGLPNNASEQEIQAAYRRLAMRFHPDINPAPDAERRMKEINQAYDLLRNPVRRSLYDDRGIWEWPEDQVSSAEWESGSGLGFNPIGVGCAGSAAARVLLALILIVSSVLQWYAGDRGLRTTVSERGGMMAPILMEKGSFVDSPGSREFEGCSPWRDVDAQEQGVRQCVIGRVALVHEREEGAMLFFSSDEASKDPDFVVLLPGSNHLPIRPGMCVWTTGIIQMVAGLPGLIAENWNAQTPSANNSQSSCRTDRVTD